MTTFIDTADNYHYIYLPLSHMRREKFRRLVSRIEGGDVLDLGCGQAGHYWALGYAHKADSLSFYDVVEENIAEQMSNIETLSPELIDERFVETCDFLRAENIIGPEVTATTQALDIIGKTSEVLQFDFVNSRADQQFDTILAMESVEIADSYDDFAATIRNVKGMLRPGGLFLGLILPYQELLPTTHEQIAIRREGILNPGLEETRRAFTEAGWVFEIETFKTFQTNYEEAICFYARHE